MKTCICDFCETKTADRRYKATRKYLTFPWGATQNVDICDDCYIALFVKKKTIGKAILERLHNAGGCDGTTDYDRGWDAAIEAAEEVVKEVTEK